MEYVVTIIPDFKYYKVVFCKNGRGVQTQNEIISTLKLLGLWNNNCVCDLMYNEEIGGIKQC